MAPLQSCSYWASLRSSGDAAFERPECLGENKLTQDRAVKLLGFKVEVDLTKFLATVEDFVELFLDDELITFLVFGVILPISLAFIGEAPDEFVSKVEIILINKTQVNPTPKYLTRVCLRFTLCPIL